MALDGQVAVITGSSRGIGRAVALAFAERGAQVVVNSHSDTAGGEELAASICARGGQALYVQGDVADPADVERLFTSAEAAYGRVDVLVNNAGLTEGMPLLESTQEHWLRILNINLMSTVLCSIRAAKTMTAQGSGTIINTSSIRGFDANGREGVMAYSAAKAAVNNFTRTLAKELAPTVRVNAVAPGFVATSYMDRVTDELKQTWLENIPLKDFIAPDDIAGAYVYLAEAPYVTGTLLTADAGFTLGHG
ncbi:3-oxoacyl-[acyl-carrier protein] reductase [Kitasatospora sp. MAP12-15]|uniref:SDR family NAD(P)-dependent oxidoreductase n=1 Tax=unclassified Kitasatospora TaxID=2633591 RepID=UPI002473059A|nr:glucose 1-dehydrogenase [Kitasatospora sp. MAP12-44]MDH6114322.1 3-oxoacyl-[acyl-carrier protein] reductase [Kitasatospora sp. MAP12-44]